MSLTKIAGFFNKLSVLKFNFPLYKYVLLRSELLFAYICAIVSKFNRLH